MKEDDVTRGRLFKKDVEYCSFYLSILFIICFKRRKIVRINSESCRKFSFACIVELSCWNLVWNCIRISLRYIDLVRTAIVGRVLIIIVW